MKRLTHATGAPVVDNQNTMTAGPRAPARSMGDAGAAIKQRHTNNCSKADPAYGAGVLAALAAAAECH